MRASLPPDSKLRRRKTAAETINTTDIHLPRRIGETIKRTWRGGLTFAYEEDGYFVRVDWSPAT
jgi:hypothetical protein